jgi:hypothetical protein
MTQKSWKDARSENVLESSRVLYVCPVTSWELALGTPSKSSKPKCWKPAADSGRFLNCSSPWISPRWAPQTMGGYTSTWPARPPPVPPPTVLEVVHPLVISTATRRGGMLRTFIFLKAFLHAISEEASFWKNVWMRGTVPKGGLGLSQKVTQHESLHLCLLLLLLAATIA